MRAIAVLALCFAAVAAVPANPQRIVGGSVTTIQNYPEMVALLYTWNMSTYWHRCGGAILNSRSILTCAHCPVGDPADLWRIRVGSARANSGGTVYAISNIFTHPEYNIPVRFNHDIAVMRTSTTIAFGSTVRAASIAGSNYNLGDNQVVWATGWGATFASGWLMEDLRHVQIWTVNQQICVQRYSTIGRVVNDNMLCSGWLDVGGRDQCQGDSGGPVYHNGVVVGVCSWGEGCAEAFFPGVNARVSRYTNWITSHS